MPDFEDAQQGDYILLGGQISNRYREFQIIAQLDQKSAFIVLLLDNLEKIMQLNPLEQARALIFLKGQINFMGNCGELTKLSAIMGDTRQRFSSKELKDVLRRIRLQSSPNPSATT